MRIPVKRTFEGGVNRGKILGEGRYLCVVTEITPPKAGASPYMTINFEEIVKAGTGGCAREFISLDGNLMPLDGFTGQGRWGRLLDALQVPDGDGDVDTRELLLRGCWVTIGSYTNKRGKTQRCIEALEKCSQADEDAILDYLARTHPQ
jgi:hypothetical protein